MEAKATNYEVHRAGLYRFFCLVQLRAQGGEQLRYRYNWMIHPHHHERDQRFGQQLCTGRTHGGIIGLIVTVYQYRYLLFG